jgi:hypothetical protein
MLAITFIAIIIALTLRLVLSADPQVASRHSSEHRYWP